MAKSWRTLKGEIDEKRFKSVSNALKEEAKYARGFRKHCLAYFRTLAKKK
jgi:alpha-glucuronidase